MIMIPLNSSAIAAAGYDGSTMLIQFTTGSTRYSFYHVPASIFEGLLSASSAGTYYNTYIRGRYSGL